MGADNESRRKTLSLPVRSDVPAADPRRRPVRAGALTASKRRPQLPAEAVAPAPEKRVKVDWRKKGSPKAKDAEAGRPESRLRNAASAARPPRTTRSETSRHNRQAAATEVPRTPKVNRTPASATTPPTSSVPAPVQNGVRVSKLLSERGLCSRREADQFIERGWVYVDGTRVTELGTRASPNAAITLDKEARALQQRLMTILLHKPVGYVSGQPEPGFQPAAVLVRPENQQRTADTPLFHPTHLKGLAPAGRLDIDSTGLLVLTQDGRVARRLIGENSKVEKEYLVRVEGHLDDNGLARLNRGLELDGKPLKPAHVEWLNADQLRFILNEGRKRQIRRMCELVGLRVVGLKRVRIGKVVLADLPVGQWRYLRDSESFY